MWGSWPDLKKKWPNIVEKGSSNNNNEHQEFNLVSSASYLEYSSYIIDIPSRDLEYSYLMRIL